MEPFHKHWLLTGERKPPKARRTKKTNNDF